MSFPSSEAPLLLINRRLGLNKPGDIRGEFILETGFVTMDTVFDIIIIPLQEELEKRGLELKTIEKFESFPYSFSSLRRTVVYTASPLERSSE